MSINLNLQSWFSFFSFHRHQTQSKNSTISSGVRAAAATLNVPIEKLESTASSPQPNIIHHNEKNHVVNNNNLNDDHMLEKNDLSLSSQQNGYTHHHKTSFTHQQESMVIRQDETSPTQTSITKHSLLQFAMQHFRNE